VLSTSNPHPRGERCRIRLLRSSPPAVPSGSSCSSGVFCPRSCSSRSSRAPGAPPRPASTRTASWRSRCRPRCSISASRRMTSEAARSGSGAGPVCSGTGTASYTRVRCSRSTTTSSWEQGSARNATRQSSGWCATSFRGRCTTRPSWHKGSWSSTMARDRASGMTPGSRPGPSKSSSSGSGESGTSAWDRLSSSIWERSCRSPSGRFTPMIRRLETRPAAWRVSASISRRRHNNIAKGGFTRTRPFFIQKSAPQGAC